MCCILLALKCCPLLYIIFQHVSVDVTHFRLAIVDIIHYRIYNFHTKENEQRHENLYLSSVLYRLHKQKIFVFQYELRHLKLDRYTFLKTQLSCLCCKYLLSYSSFSDTFPVFLIEFVFFILQKAHFVFYCECTQIKAYT